MARRCCVVETSCARWRLGREGAQTQRDRVHVSRPNAELPVASRLVVGSSTKTLHGCQGGRCSQRLGGIVPGHCHSPFPGRWPWRCRRTAWPLRPCGSPWCWPSFLTVLRCTAVVRPRRTRFQKSTINEKKRIERARLAQAEENRDPSSCVFANHPMGTPISTTTPAPSGGLTDHAPRTPNRSAPCFRRYYSSYLV